MPQSSPQKRSPIRKPVAFGEPLAAGTRQPLPQRSANRKFPALPILGNCAAIKPGACPMVTAYPQFRSSYSHEEMVEHFLLAPAELQLVLTCRGDANRCGMALLLKTISHLGYVPDPMPLRYQRGFVHSLPPNSACSGIPLSPILGTAALLIIIWRKFVSRAAGVFRRRKIRRSWKTGFATTVRKKRTRPTPCLIPRASDCGACGWNCRRRANSSASRRRIQTHQ